jgi:methylenetetrahydrofolate--tRNA-(uracil-5-)-methyltransferase
MTKSNGRVTVVGGGLAGCEAAWHAANAGCAVRLYEMRPVRPTEAHKTEHLAELVCSNSFRNASLDTAVGLLKDEMRRLGSLIMRVADAHAVPAGAALAVDRDGFAAGVTQAIAEHPSIELVREEVAASPRRRRRARQRPAHFAVAVRRSAAPARPGPPLLLRRHRADRHRRLDRPGDCLSRLALRQGRRRLLQLPLYGEEYYAFVEAMLAAEKVPTRDFERCVYFEGCMPIEEMARRGRDTLAFGPMRPVGLIDPRTGRRPYAVAQARQDDRAGTLYNMVGFQTKMTYPEQRRVFRMVPGLENASFVRLGSLHRNTFINSPQVLRPTLQLRGSDDLFLAGQLVGVEGYVESAATGILAGLNAARTLAGADLLVPPATTALGSLLRYVTDRTRREFQPMNANYGLFPPLQETKRLRGRERRQKLGERAQRDAAIWMGETGLVEKLERAADS